MSDAETDDQGNYPDDDDDDDEYPDSGPFCRHWSEMGGCDALCARCGHTCSPGHDDACEVEGCDCEEWGESERTDERHDFVGDNAFLPTRSPVLERAAELLEEACARYRVPHAVCGKSEPGVLRIQFLYPPDPALSQKILFEVNEGLPEVDRIVLEWNGCTEHDDCAGPLRRISMLEIALAGAIDAYDGCHSTSCHVFESGLDDASLEEAIADGDSGGCDCGATDTRDALRVVQAGDSVRAATGAILTPGTPVEYQASRMQGRWYSAVVDEAPRKLGASTVVRLRDVDPAYSRDHHPGQNRTTIVAASTDCVRLRSAEATSSGAPGGGDEAPPKSLASQVETEHGAEDHGGTVGEVEQGHVDPIVPDEPTRKTNRHRPNEASIDEYERGFGDGRQYEVLRRESPPAVFQGGPFWEVPGSARAYEEYAGELAALRKVAEAALVATGWFGVGLDPDDPHAAAGDDVRRNLRAAVDALAGRSKAVPR